MIDVLLAKSGPPSPGRTLTGHTVQVMDAARALVERRIGAARQAMGQRLEGLETRVRLDRGPAGETRGWTATAFLPWKGLGRLPHPLQEQ